MKDNRFERVIYILLRVFGVLAILGGFLGNEGNYGKQVLLSFNGSTIFGNIYMIEPKALVEMVVAIVLYLVFIKVISRYVSISRKRA
jgi:hypothetical protein